VTPIPGLAEHVPEDALQPVACGFCGSDSSDLKFKDGLFSVVTCRECDLTYVTPRLTNSDLIEHVYNEGYWNSSQAKTRGYTNYVSDAELYLRTYRRRLSVVRRYFDTPGRVLDVGCAAAYFLSVMQDEGWQVTGLEPSEAVRAEAASRIGAENVHDGLLGACDLAPGSFDLITLWDVLEHIPDPVAALAAARELLAPGGKLLIETQNVDSRAAKWLGPKWQHYKHTEHIYHFNPKTLKEILDRAGLRVLENKAALGGKYVSLSFISERAGRLHPVLSTLLTPLNLIGGLALYVNLFDEMIVVTEPASTD